MGLPFNSEEEKTNIERVLELWHNSCICKTNVIYKHYKFNNRLQENGESVDTFASFVRALADTCEFGNLKEDLIRDCLVCGIADNSVRKKLLQEPHLTLSKCIDICRAAETTKEQLKAISNQSSLPQGSGEVNQVRRGKSQPKISEGMITNCKFCGHSHERKKEKCPAYGKTCTNCGKKNHFNSKCHGKEARQEARPSKKYYPKRKVHAVGSYQETSSEEEILSVTLTANQATEIYDVNKVTEVPFKTKIFASMLIADKLVRMQVDTGASCNVLPRKYLPENSEIDKTD